MEDEIDAVAEERIDVKYADGTMIPVHLRMSRPHPHPDGQGDWNCVVLAEGLKIWEGPRRLHGEGSCQTLMIASWFLYKMLTAEIERGAVVCYPGETEKVDLDALFLFPGKRDDSDCAHT